MAIRVKQKIRKLEAIKNGLKAESVKILQRHEKEIVQLNKSQMIDGYGSDDKNLFNILRQYDGVYNQGYKKSGLYDFYETGAFIRGLFAKVTTNGIFVDSTGKGSGEKSLFFAGYTNMFGLNSDSIQKLRALIAPELKAYLKSRL
jgi:hypothetical protein